MCCTRLAENTARKKSPKIRHTAPKSLNGGQPNFAGCLAVLWAGTVHIHFQGLFPTWWNFAMCKVDFPSKSCVLLYWQRYYTAFEQWASAKLCGVVQAMELRNLRSSSFSTEGATYIPRVAVTLVISLHFIFFSCKAHQNWYWGFEIASTAPTTC